MDNLEELARKWVINNYSFAYLNDDMNGQRLANAYKAGYLAAIQSQEEDLKEAFEAGQDFEHNFTEQGVIPEFPDFEDWYKQKFKKQ